MEDCDYSIRVYKQYFNFSSSHFLVFKDGTREPLHGHNYRVMVSGDAPKLESDMVFDFLDIKPLVKEVCDQLDHKLILPMENPFLKIEKKNTMTHLFLKGIEEFIIPTKDIIFLPIRNTSAERLAMYLANQLHEKVYQKFNFLFSSLKIEVEETPGQSALYILKK